MPPSFWIKRYVIVFLGVFVVLFALGLLKERGLAVATRDSVLWAGITATIFIVTRIYRSRKGQACELCRDTPEMRQGEACPVKKEGPGL